MQICKLHLNSLGICNKCTTLVRDIDIEAVYEGGGVCWEFYFSFNFALNLKMFSSIN